MRNPTLDPTMSRYLPDEAAYTRVYDSSEEILLSWRYQLNFAHPRVLWTLGRRPDEAGVFNPRAHASLESGLPDPSTRRMFCRDCRRREGRTPLMAKRPGVGNRSDVGARSPRPTPWGRVAQT